MNPWRIANEFLKEFGGRDHSGKASAGIGDIRNSASDQVAILIVHGHLPHFFSSAFGRSEKRINERLLISHYADAERTERNARRACQRRKIDEMRCAERARVRQSISQY